MEKSAFSIACTTCHARLKIRDASLVGQIIGCPKCGSMVLVTPAGETPANEPPAAAPTPAPLPEVDSIESRLEESRAALLLEAGGIQGAPPNISPPPSLPQNQEAPGPGVAPSCVEPPLAGPAATSREGLEAKAEQAPLADVSAGFHWWWWVAGGTGGGLALALICFLLLALLGSGGQESNVAPQVATGPDTTNRDKGIHSGDATSTPPVGKSANEKTTTSPGEDLPGGGPAGVEPPPGAATGSPPREHPAAANPEKPGDKTGEKPGEHPGGKPLEKPLEKPNAAPTEKKSPENPAKPAAEVGAADKPEPDGPPGLKPRATLPNGGGPEPVAGRFTKLITGDFPLGDGKPEGAPSKEPGGALPGEKPGEKPGEESPDTEVIRPRLREIDVAARLADPIARMRLKEMPLADFVSLMTDMSTVPVTLDLNALRSRWVSVAAPVSVDVEQTTVRGVLGEGVESWQLGLLIESDQVLVSYATSPESIRRRRTHDVADLVGSDAKQMDALTQWIRELVEPNSWVESGGEGTIKGERSTLVIENRDGVHFQTLYLCDKLRAARKLPPRGKYAANLLAPGGLPARGERALKTPISLNYHRPTRLAQILTRLGQIAEARILLDWRALQEAGWTPDTMARLKAEDEPLSQVLARLLSPAELTYRVLDDTTLEVTTPLAVSRRLEWEFYPVGAMDEAQLKGMIASLEAAVGPNYFLPGGGAGSIRFDAASRSLLVALAEPEQRVAAKWLAERQKK